MTVKILFVTHDISFYGASKSLQALIKLLPSHVECGLVVQRPILNKLDLTKIKTQFGVRKVYSIWLPFLDCCVGLDRFTLKDRVSIWLKSLLSIHSRYKLPRLAKLEGYDLIHLNSIVLIPLISKKYQFTLHVRELWDNSYQQLVAKRVQEAVGLVFIDNVVRKPFAELKVQRSVVIDNPVVFSENEKFKFSQDKFWLRDKLKGKLVLSIIGKVTVEKGILFLIDAMRKLDGMPVVLLVVGEWVNQKMRKKLSNVSDQIIYYGIEPNIENIYEIADVVVRAEDQPRVGRTIYEALYYGLSVLIPGGAQDYPIDLVTKYSDRIYFYKTRDISDFVSKTESLIRFRPHRKSRSPTNLDCINDIVTFFNDIIQFSKDEKQLT